MQIAKLFLWLSANWKLFVTIRKLSTTLWTYLREAFGPSLKSNYASKQFYSKLFKTLKLNYKVLVDQPTPVELLVLGSQSCIPVTVRLDIVPRFAPKKKHLDAERPPPRQRVSYFQVSQSTTAVPQVARAGDKFNESQGNLSCESHAAANLSATKKSIRTRNMKTQTPS